MLGFGFWMLDENKNTGVRVYGNGTCNMGNAEWTMNKSLIPFILVLCFLSGFAFSQTADKDLKRDTTLIYHLFDKGYEFIDGPSDSLLHYFNEALIIIDSRLEQLQKDPDPSWNTVFKRLKWRVLIEFGIEHFFKSDYSTALKYFHASLNFAVEINDPDLLSESNSEIAIVLKNQGKIDEALPYYQSALEYARMGTDTSWMASCLVNLGNAYKEKRYLIISLGYYLDALKTLESLDHFRRISACYQNIGEVYSLQNDYDKALSYYKKAQQLSSQEGDKMREASCLMNIGYVQAVSGKYQEARKHYDLALEYFKESGYTHEMDDCYILIGDSWLGEGNAQQAVLFFTEAEKISRQEEDKRKLAEIYCRMGEAFLLQGKSRKAIQYCKRCLEIAKETDFLEIERKTYKILSEIYEQSGELSIAFDYFKEYSRLKDSIFNEHKYSALAELEIKYETEKKEQQLALYSEQAEVQRLKITQRNRMLIAIAAVLLLLLVLSYLLIRQNRLRARQKAVELEQKLLRSQMNPHFIFNSLIAIQSFIYSKDALQAGDYLAKFAELVRHTLQSSRTELISLEKEIEMMKVYLDLQKLRFEEHFEYKLEVDDQLEVEDLYIPPMFAQPFIENAIEHGLRHRGPCGLVRIRYSMKEQDVLQIKVTDNGIGREASAGLGEKSGHKSMGIAITEERLGVLSKKYNRKFTMQTRDLKDDEGSNAGFEVQIDVPVRETPIQ